MGNVHLNNLKLKWNHLYTEIYEEINCRFFTDCMKKARSTINRPEVCPPPPGGDSYSPLMLQNEVQRLFFAFIRISAQDKFVPEAFKQTKTPQNNLIRCPADTVVCQQQKTLWR